MLQIHTGILSSSVPSPATHVHCVGQGSPLWSQHSGPSWAFHGGDRPPPGGRYGQLSSALYCWKGDWQDHSTPSGSFSTPLEAGEESHRRDLSSMFMTVGDTDTFWHPQFSVPKSLHLQRRELSYLPSAGRVPFCLVATVLPFIYDFYLQHWIHTSVSCAQISSGRLYCVFDGTHCSADVCCAGFSGSGGHTFPRADADRDLAKRQLLQRLSDEILHVRSRLDDPPDARGTDQNGRVTFLPKLFGTDAVQSPRSGIVDTAMWARLAFSLSVVLVLMCSFQMVGPSCCSTHAVRELPG